MSSSSAFNTLLSKAKSYVSDTIDGVKDALGFDQYPQASTSHNAPYLNDIAQGSWSLSPVLNSSMRISYFPVVGVPSNYQWNFKPDYTFNTNFVRYPFLQAIGNSNGNFNLRPAKKMMKDGSIFSWHGPYEMRQAIDRNRLLHEISSFDRKRNLRMTGLQKPYYLNDIERGDWRQNLIHVSPREVNYPVVGFGASGFANPWGMDMKSMKFKPNWDRRALLDQIRNKSYNLQLVQPTSDEKGRLNSMLQGYKYNQKNLMGNRQQLLQQIRKFDRRTGLTDVSSGPSLIQQAKDFVQDNFVKMQTALGFSSSNSSSGPMYLSDIANGNWKLRNRGDPRITYNPVVDFPAGWGWFNSGKNFSLRKGIDNGELLKEIRSGRMLKHVESMDKTNLRMMGNWGEYKMKRGNRMGLLKEIREFDKNRMSHEYSDRKYLRDVTRGYNDTGLNRLSQEKVAVMKQQVEGPRKELMNEIRGFETGTLQNSGSS